MIAIIKSKTQQKWIAFQIVICLLLCLQINTFQYQDPQKLNSHQSKLQVISHASDSHSFQQKGKQNEAAELLSTMKIDQKSLVLQLDAKNFKKTLDSYDHVVIYFYTEQCSQCQEFDKTYEDMNKKQHQNLDNLNQQVIFAKILLTEQTQEIFKGLNIQSVPNLKYFYKNKPTNYSYNFNQYGNSSINNHLKWIKRSKRLSQFQSKVKQTNQFFVFNKLSLIRKNFYIPEIQNLESVGSHISQPTTKVLILNCSHQEKQGQNIELSSFLKQIFIKHLEKEFFCTYNSTILNPKQIKNTNLAQVNIQVYEINGKSKDIEHSETINLDNKVEYGIQGTRKHLHQKDDQTIHSPHLQQVYHQNFNRYANKEIQQWTEQSAIQIFTEHQPGFLLIINNQTKSHKVLEWYKEIKQELNLNISLPGVKFYFSDLSITPQTTTRIKKYLSGIATALKKTYPYPLLGFMIQKDDYVKKFLFPIQREMTKQDLKQWIVSVIDQIILMKQPSTQQFKHTSEHQTAESHQKLQQDHAIQQTSEEEQQQQQNQESQGLKVTQFFRSTPQSLFPASYTNLFNKIYFDPAVSEQQKEQKLKMQDQLLERHHEMRFINFYDFRILLSRFYPKDFFVYINWKNQFHAYEIYNEISEWWQVEEQQKEEPKDTQNQKEIAQNPQTAQNNNQLPHDQNTNLAQTNQPHQQHQNAQNDDGKVVRQLDQIQTNQAQNSQLPNYPEQQQIKSAIKDKQQHAKALQLEKQKLLYDEVTSKSNIFILNFNNNDYPATYTDSLNKTHQLKINNVPSILYFSHDRQFMDILDGIQSFDQVKNFIFKQIDHLKKEAQQSSPQPLLQTGKKSQVKDLSESNRDLLSVNNNQKKI